MKKTDFLYLLIIMLLIYAFAGSVLNTEPLFKEEGTTSAEPTIHRPAEPSVSPPAISQSSYDDESAQNTHQAQPSETQSAENRPAESQSTGSQPVEIPNSESQGEPEFESESGSEPVADPDDEPVINARSAIVMEFDTGSILYEKNAYRKRPMASTTKIMTAIVAIENCDLDEDVIISGKAANMGGSVIGLKSGSTVKLKDLLYGMLIHSGNDAAVAIAEHAGGSIEGFSELMNKKALELGAFSTSFSNPHGLDAEDHYTTAYDLAKITRYALKIPIFNEIVRTKEFEYNGRILRSTNEMLSLYDGADGVKTGYTGLAGRCLVTSATKNNMRLISVVLFCDTKNLRTSSSSKILNYSFNEYAKVTLLNQGELIGNLKVDRSRTSQEIIVAVSEDLKTVLKHGKKDSLYTRASLPERLTAPVRKGSILGTVSVFQGEKIIAETSLIAYNNAERKELGDYMSQVIGEWIGMFK